MSLPPIQIPTASSLADGLYEGLRNAILEGALQPGDKITERSLALHVKISRTPVRQALQRLQNEGMLEPSGRSLVVSNVSLETLTELCIVRQTLEGLAAYLAAMKRNESDLFALTNILNDMESAVEKNDFNTIIHTNNSFHTLIWQASQNQYLIQRLSELRSSIMRMQNSTLHSKERQIESLEEHREILKVISNSDAEAAERLTREHFRKAENLRIAMLKIKAIKNLS